MKPPVKPDGQWPGTVAKYSETCTWLPKRRKFLPLTPDGQWLRTVAKYSTALNRPRVTIPECLYMGLQELLLHARQVQKKNNVQKAHKKIGVAC